MKESFVSPSSLLVPALAFSLLTPAVGAQWSTDPAVNISVADGGGDQVQAKVAARTDGGVYVSWFDGIASGFDVRVQSLDVTGSEVFAHNGVLVADRGFSSTQDYGLDVDASGSALLAYRDDGGVGTQIGAARISAAGAVQYSVQVTSTTDFVAAPAIAGTSDGGAVVAWTQNSSVVVQKLDASGVAQWGAGVTLTPGVGSYSVSDLHDAGNDAILSFVHQTGGFGSPRHILAQKLDGTGAFLWGAGHVAVFDGGSLQFGNFPDFVPDGTGGAVFSWYSTSPLQCYVQRILSAGTEAFAHNGVAVSTDATRVRVSPSASFDPSTSQISVFWVEQNALQSMAGLYGQRIDAAGARLWGTEGSTLVPISSDQVGLVQTLRLPTGTFAFWGESAGFGLDRLFGGRLDAAGAFDVGPFDVASTTSGKTRLDAELSSAGFAALAWGDDRVDAGDILAQNVNGDGSLGCAATVEPVAPTLGLNSDTLTTTPVAIGNTWTATLTPDPLRTTSPVSAWTILLTDAFLAPGFPVDISSAVGLGPGPTSELHLAGPPLLGIAPIPAGPHLGGGVPVTFSTGIPLSTAIVCLPWACQAIVLGDIAPLAVEVDPKFSTAVHGVIGL